MKPLSVLFFCAAISCHVNAAPLAVAQSQQEDKTASPNQSIFVRLAERIVPSVVNISTIYTVKSPFPQGTPEEFFRHFFGDFFGNDFGVPPDEEGRGPESQAPAPRPSRRLRAISLGSGFIINSSGIILTNNHVVANAEEIKIQFTEASSEKPTDGKVIGRDPELDVALIQVKTKREMLPLALGDSDSLKVGEYVMAVGNPFGQGHTATHGIISAKGRLNPAFPIGNYLQTDAPINPGNSGGPLVTLDGKVIGINTAIQANAQGIGFAIPINLVKSVLDQLQKTGSVQRGYIGAAIEPLTPEVAAQFGLSKDLQAPLVTHVYAGGPGDKAGLKDYDVITEIAGQAVHSPDELVRAVASIKTDKTVPLKIIRNGKKMDLSITVGKRPVMGQTPAAPKPRKKEEAPPAHIKTGMMLENLNEESARVLGIKGKPSGVLVADVAAGSPADIAEIMSGDVIVEADRKPVEDLKSFYGIVNKKKPYVLKVRRRGLPGTEGYVVVVLDLSK